MRDEHGHVVRGCRKKGTRHTGMARGQLQVPGHLQLVRQSGALRHRVLVSVASAYAVDQTGDELDRCPAPQDTRAVGGIRPVERGSGAQETSKPRPAGRARQPVCGGGGSLVSRAGVSCVLSSSGLTVPVCPGRPLPPGFGGADGRVHFVAGLADGGTEPGSGWTWDCARSGVEVERFMAAGGQETSH